MSTINGIAGQVITGAAGGASINTGTDASKTPSADGNLFLPNNGYQWYRDTGVAFAPWGPIFPLTSPGLLSTWTWRNQGSATAADSNGGVVLSVASEAGNNLHILEKTVSGSFTVDWMGLQFQHTANATRSGIAIVDSASGKVITFEQRCLSQY